MLANRLRGQSDYGRFVHFCMNLESFRRQLNDIAYQNWIRFPCKSSAEGGHYDDLLPPTK
jgi:hypothetical protein